MEMAHGFSTSWSCFLFTIFFCEISTFPQMRYLSFSLAVLKVSLLVHLVDTAPPRFRAISDFADRCKNHIKSLNCFVPQNLQDPCDTSAFDCDEKEGVDQKLFTCTVCMDTVDLRNLRSVDAYELAMKKPTKRDQSVVSLKCNHYYHRACIYPWLSAQEGNFCPCCKISPYTDRIPKLPPRPAVASSLSSTRRLIYVLDYDTLEGYRNHLQGVLKTVEDDARQGDTFALLEHGRQLLKDSTYYLDESYGYSSARFRITVFVPPGDDQLQREYETAIEELEAVEMLAITTETELASCESVIQYEIDDQTCKKVSFALRRLVQASINAVRLVLAYEEHALGAPVPNI